MPFLKGEINNLKRVFAQRKNFIKSSNSSADTLRQHMLVRNWILELRSNKNKIQKN
jgi:hypothetical protein